MTRINPSRAIVDIDGDPIRTGEVKSAATRMELARMKDEAAGAPPGGQAALFERYQEALRNAQPVLTLGGAIVNSLMMNLEGDDKISATTKLERHDLCLEIYRAEKAGEMVELSAEQAVVIKERAAKFYNTGVVGQLVRAVEGKDQPALAVAAE